MNTNEINYRLSRVITWLRFPLIFFIIMLHCYSVQRLEGNHDLYFKWLYPFSLWLGETGVPGFFFISGFLFFLSKKDYSHKLSTRVHTLLIPYLLWNALLLVLYIGAYAIGYPQVINGKNIADFNVLDYFRLFWDRGSFDDWNFVPLLCPLWYIRNLLIMSIISPLLYLLIRYIREIFLIMLAVWWFFTYNNAFIPQSLLFFCLGSYFSIFNKNPLKLVLDKRTLFLLLFVIFGASDLFSHIIEGTPVNLQLHRFSLIFNIPALLLLADFSIQHGLTCKLLPKAAFIVFCVHYPIVVILRKFCISYFHNATDAIHIMLYFICIIIATLFSLTIYLFLDRYFPKIKIILSGNR